MSNLEGKILVLLNANAGSYSDDTFWQAWDFARKQAGSVVLRRTRDPDDAQGFFTEALASGEYSVVVQGGGDGTLGQILEWQTRYLNSHENCRPLKVLPTFLGTGNAIAREAGARPRTWMQAAKKLQQRSYDAIPTLGRKLLDVDFQKIGEEESEQHVALLAGVGIDAQFIGRYEELKSQAKGRWDATLRHGILGYLAVIPDAISMLRKRPGARIILADPSYRVQGISQNCKREEIDTEQQQFIVASAGQVSQFGACFKAFPSLDFREELLKEDDANPKDYMQVVLAEGSATQIAGQMLATVPALWIGKFRPPVIQDYLCPGLTIESTEGVDLQLNGDYMGLCSRVRIASSDRYAGIIDCKFL